MLKQNLKTICTGCSACVNSCPKNCIKMEADENGFLYPVMKDIHSCLKCGVCEKVCPAFKEIDKSHKGTRAYAAYSLDEDNRWKSSSGGVFTEFAKRILSNSGYVCGAVYNSDFSVSHRVAHDIEEIEKFRGAKYSQSDLGDVFLFIKQQLKNDEWVLFSGTPCQVAGLKSFLKKDYEKLICIDFVCHSVPSPKIWKKYIEYRSYKDNDGKLPLFINLRSKHTGWSNYCYSNLYQYEDGKNYSELSGNDLFMKLFIDNYINRESCSDCKFKGLTRMSDITLADFWGIWDIAPEMDDNKGTSLVLIHSQKGENLLSQIEAKIKIKEVTLEEAIKYNPSMLISSTKNPKFKEIQGLLRDGNFDRIEKMINKREKKSFYRKMKEKIKNVLK